MHLNPLSSAWFELGVARHTIAVAGGDGAIAMVTEAVAAYTQALNTTPGRQDVIIARLQHLREIQTQVADSAVAVTA